MFGITTSCSTGLPALDAREDFGRARRSRLTARVGHCITGRLSRERRPRWLLEPAALAAGTARLEVVTLDAGFASVAMADIAFDVDFESEDDAVAAQLPAAAAVRHSGCMAVEAALRSFFAPRPRADGTVRMGVVFRCYLAEPRSTDEIRASVRS